MRLTTKLALVSATAAVVGACATEPPKPAAAPGATPAAEAPRVIRPQDAAILAGNCFACHGPDGHSPGTMPSLDRLQKARIISDMKDFKGGAPSTVMGRQAKGYSDAEIEAIADYIVSLRKKK